MESKRVEVEQLSDHFVSWKSCVGRGVKMRQQGLKVSLKALPERVAREECRNPLEWSRKRNQLS